MDNDLNVKKQAINNSFQNEINEVLNVIDEYKDIIYVNGKKVINNNPDKEWFKNNVSFYFSKGCVFDDFDMKYLQTIESYFDKNNNIYLANVYQISDYFSNRTQSLEKLLNISNGNYHILLILVVITEDKSILENAPESLFSKYGIVDYYINHSDISNILKILFSKYSLINEPEEKLKNLPTKGQLLRCVNKNDDVERFSINNTVDYQNSDYRELYSNLMINNQKNQELSKRQKFINDKRLGNYDTINKRINNKSLYQRSNNAENNTTIINSKAPITGNNGIYNRTDDQILPDKYYFGTNTPIKMFEIN